MIKEIKYNGFTATPDDYQCADGDLAAAINLFPKDDTLKPVMPPELIGTLANLNGNGSRYEQLLFVHVVNNGDKHLIIGRQLTGPVRYQLCYVRLEDFLSDNDTERHEIKTYTEPGFKCSAIGNVLAIYNVYGLDTMDHFIWLHGQYVPFNTEDYAVTVLFGLDSLQVSNSKGNSQLVLLDSNGQQYTNWTNVIQYDFTRVSASMSIEDISLTSGETYRIHLVRGTKWEELYYRIKLYDSNDEYDIYDCGQVANYHQFTPSRNVVKIDIFFRYNPDYSGIPQTRKNGTVVIDQAVGASHVSGDYAYNGENETVNNVLLAAANELLAAQTEANRFALPFFVRYGFRMIGGDIITVSPPILMEPNTGVTPVIQLDNIEEHATHTPTAYNADITAKLFSSKLQYQVRDLEKMRRLLAIDKLVDTLVIAVSDPVYLYKQGATLQEMKNEVIITNTPPDNRSYSIDGVKSLTTYDPQTVTSSRILTLPHFDDYEEKLTSASTFKIVAEIPKNEISLAAEFVDVPLDEGRLSGLAGNVSLLPDNVENLSSYDTQYMMTYNQREHWVGVTKNLFAGFDLDAMCGYVATDVHDTNYKVGINLTDATEMQYLVRGKRSEYSSNRRWFYYPDKNAENVDIYVREYIETNNSVTNNDYNEHRTLMPHPFLNGSYHFKQHAIETTSALNSEIDTPQTLLTEDKGDMLYVSYQGNPLLVEQTLRIGDGRLFAAASNTNPISRGQFGTAPLYIFASDGVWGLEVSNTGTYSVRQSVSRDILANVESITPIDKAVLFATERGIMMIVGSKTECISDQLNSDNPFNLSDLGTTFSDYITANYPDLNTTLVPFRTFVKNCRMLYDYTNQRIILYSPYATTASYAYVYSLEDKKWGMMPSNIQYAVNAYPEAWAVTERTETETVERQVDGETVEQQVQVTYQDIVNFSSYATQDSESETTETYHQLLVTRPIKLDYPNALKTVDTIIQRGYFHKGNIQSVLFGSRDLFNWHLVYSSTDHYLRGFRGTPYKYFRIALLCQLTPEESIYGCTVQYTPRLTDQPR